MNEIPPWFRIQGLTTMHAIADCIIDLQSQVRDLEKIIKLQEETKEDEKKDGTISNKG